MEKIAFVYNGLTVNWARIILILASLGAIVFFLGIYLSKSGNRSAALTVVPLAVVLSVVLARLLHWYCYAETYDSLLSAMTDYSAGGFGLLGVFVGCVAAAVVTRVAGLHYNLLEMLDCMCLAGLGGISAGRLSAFFSTADRGQILETVRTFPLAYPVTNVVSGAVEYRLATFALQAIAALVLLVALLLFCCKKNRVDGEVTLLFSIFYSATQIILDSTRYDSMYFRWNGFVSIVQVVGAVALVSAIVVISIRLVKNAGFRPGYIALWGLIIAGLGGAGYMEYHVQRHGDQALFAYSGMSLCLILVAVLALVMHHLAQKMRRVYVGGRYLRKT